MASAREEQMRNSRRLSRQLLGAVALILAIIGLFTVLGWVLAGVRAALDDSGRKEEYADKLYGLVMFDVVPFEDAMSVDANVFRQAAIWGSLYQMQKADSTLEGYERDPDTGSLIMPKLVVDTYLANLLGPDYVVADGNFDTPEFVYTYNEEKQGYLVPVTGSVGLYTPEVERISTRGGLTYVTVGYIPTNNNNSSSGELSLAAPTTPTKYMDYVFARGDNRRWYLKSLQESTMQPEATATPLPTAATEQTDPQALVESNLDATVASSAADAETADNPEEAPVPEDAAVDGEVPADGEATTDEETPTDEEVPADGEADSQAQ